MSGHLIEAERKIQAKGERVTDARVQVLAALQASASALTHPELEQRLHGDINRVTIYRVLDWLTDKHLVHKIAGNDRIWRFTAGDDELHQHAHFQCETCGQVVCLDDVNLAYAVRLPEGFRSTHIEMTIKGDCAACAGNKAG
jgi:Fur family ferric uptake transcriptional regulator